MNYCKKEMSKAEEILSEKESYNFLRGAKRVLVRVAMEEHTNQTLDRLKDNLTQYRIIQILDNLNKCNTSEKSISVLRNNILQLIEELE